MTQETTKEKVRKDILKEDLKYKSNMIIKMFRQLEAYESQLEAYAEAENEVNELIRQYDTGEMTATMLVSNLKIVVRS